VISFPQTGNAKQDVCAADAEKLCKGVEPGQGRILSCLKEKWDEVSPECQAYVASELQEAKAKQESIEQACGKEVKEYCKDVQAGQGRVLNCLKEHEASLSEECKTSLAR
jgi:hypothetical protein